MPVTEAEPRSHRSGTHDTRRGFLDALLIAAVVTACGAPSKGTIGAVLLRKKEGRVFLQDAPQHLAAAKAGLQAGDEILTIEGQDVRRLSDADLSRVLGGGVGERVRLTVARGDEVIRVELKRSLAEPYRVK